MEQSPIFSTNDSLRRPTLIAWDPSVGLVLAAAVAVALPFIQLEISRGAPKQVSIFSESEYRYS
jgi:hypothetical protein